jgi:hypothetical protein
MSRGSELIPGSAATPLTPMLTGPQTAAERSENLGSLARQIGEFKGFF